MPTDVGTIQAAVDRVAEGGLVLVEPGRYAEQVVISTPGVTLRGADRNAVVIDGEGERSAGVVAIANGVRIENLTVQNATFYGVLVTRRYDDGSDGGYDDVDPEDQPLLERFRVDHVTAINNGAYGIYAFSSRHGVIADSLASGSADSGIYVGQCRRCDVLVEGNVAVNNAIGFENANASDSVTITGNRFTGNRVGLTLTSNALEAFLPQEANVVAGNVISDNTSATSPAQASGGFGTGVGIAGGRDNVVAANRIEGNPRAGVLITDADDLEATGNEVRDNAFSGNGIDVADLSEPEGPVLPTVEAPDGISFQDVPRPADQPSMPLDRTVPPPLPDAIEHPSGAGIEVPSADLLADRLR